MIDQISSRGASLLSRLPEQKPADAPQKNLVSQFADRLEKTSELMEQAESAAVSMSRGDAGSVETVLALSRAELALRHIVSVRNRAIEAYNEVMRLPV